MIRSQLNAYSGGDPIWGFVALIGTERFSGEAAVGIDPRVRLFAVDGRIYFAERDGDAPVGTRLVNCGAITAAQLEHGAVQLGDTTSLSRLFQREPSIDRDAVELTIEFATESLLASIANKPVGMPEVFPLRHHSTGIHHWLRAATPNPAAPAGPPEPAVAAEPAAVVAEAVAEPVAVVEEPVAVVEEPVAVVEEPVAVVEEPVAVVEEPVAVVEEPAAVPVFEAPVAEPVEAPVAEPTFELRPLAAAPVLAPIVAEPVAELEVAQPVVAEPAAEVDAPMTQTPAEAPADGYADSPWTEQARSSWEPDPSVYVAEPFAAEPVSKPAATEALPALTPWAAIPASHPAAPEPADDPFAALDAALLDGGAEAGAPAPVADITLEETSIAEQPVAEAPAPAPTLSLLALPTLNGSNGSNGRNGHAHESLTPPTATPPTATAADEITATLPVIPAEEPPSQPFATLGGLTPLMPLTAPDAAPEPALAAPSAEAPADDLFYSLPEQPSYEPGPTPEGLPKLASAPISMTDLKAANAEAAAAPFGGPTHNLAAVDIWEMVDVLMDDGQPADQDLVNSGGSEKRSRGWLRGRKG